MGKAPKKTQKIKERLNKHLEMLDKLAAINMEILHVYGTLRSPSFSGMPGGGDHRTSEEERLFQRKAELEQKAERQQEAIDRDWSELEPLIETLQPFEMLVTNLRYRYGSEWEDVCREIFGKRNDYDMNIDKYSDKMFKAHGRALLALAEMISK